MPKRKPPEVGPDEFERLVSDALDSLPSELAERVDNVQVVVEDVPDAEAAAEAGVDPTELLGLYQGIPITERDSGYFGVLPDRIVLYRLNLIRSADSADGIREAVRTTVIHEVAHYFGIDDDRLEELGWA